MSIHKEALKFLLGLKIKKMRLIKGLSLSDLAKIADLSISYLNEIEKGKKYPKVEKLLKLAQALDTPFDKLISSKPSKEMEPLIEFLESDLYKDFPLIEFGIKKEDLYELMGNNPQKFSSLLMTIIEIARNYDLQVENLYSATLRSYIEMNKNYFPEIEKKVEKFQVESKLNANTSLTIDKLTCILNNFKVAVDETTLGDYEELSTLRSLVKEDKKKKTLYLNPKLHDTQKAYVMGREIGCHLLKIKSRISTGSGIKPNNFEDVLNDFKTSYFSGALLLNKQILTEKLDSFFKKKQFRSEALNEMMNEFNVSVELFFHRLTQVLPASFKLNQLFFLRFESKKDSNRYDIKKELHLSKLHYPHGIGLNEHYCRRWITVSLLEDLTSKMQGSKTSILCDAQISTMLETKEEYLCLSVARASKLKPDTGTCMTIGIQINKHSQEMIKFINDPNIPRKEVSQTCERCPLTDCKQRAHEPTLYNAQLKQKSLKAAIDQILNSD